MKQTFPSQQPAWPLWRKIIFRFFFILLALVMAPWTWVDDTIPGLHYVTKPWYTLMDWAVDAANAKIFHVAKELVPLNGSGDTSYGWCQAFLFLLVALAGMVIWSVLDRRRFNYTHLNYWLCLFARYYIAMFAFVYGIIKIFMLQMVPPNLHQLATPLGDFLPMRFSWLFIGYSGPYQVFSGVMETLAGLLLLYRRTSTLGILFATAVFINVAALNLSYDIPVKIFSLELVLVCLFLLANESNRILCFFVLNKPAAVCELYHFRYTRKWMRITRIVLKITFIICIVGLQVKTAAGNYTGYHKAPARQPVPNGVYEVAVFAINKDSLPMTGSDTLRWQDLIFENGTGSIKTADTAFRHRYKRAYFNYALDSATHTLGFKKQYGDSLFMMRFRFDAPDSNTLKLWGKEHNDSLYIVLKKTRRHFQLAENQFHWLSEYNR